MISIDDGLVAVKTDDILALKQHIRTCIAAASNDGGSDGSFERQQRYLSMHDHSRQRSTLLHWASYLGNTVAVKLLAHHGADVDATEADGKTPLHWGAFEGHKDVVQYLLMDRQANHDVQDVQGNTPCHLALLNEHMEVARLFPNYRQVIAGDMVANNRGGGQRSPQRRTVMSEYGAPSPTRPTTMTTLLGRAQTPVVPFNAGALEHPQHPRSQHGWLIERGAVARAEAPESTTSDDAAPVPAPSLSVRPMMRNSAHPQETLSEQRRKSEERRLRKEMKQQKLRDDLFARLVAEAPTPQKTIQWVPRALQSQQAHAFEHTSTSTSAVGGTQRILFHQQPYERDASRNSSAQRRSTTPRPFAVAAIPPVNLPDTSLYSRQSTPTQRRSSTPNRARPFWKPPSNIYKEKIEVPVPSVEAIQHQPPPPRISISRLDVRSY